MVTRRRRVGGRAERSQRRGRWREKLSVPSVCAVSLRRWLLERHRFSMPSVINFLSSMGVSYIAAIHTHTHRS